MVISTKLKKYSDLASRTGLIPIVPMGKQTHQSGNQLDQIFTNIFLKTFQYVTEEFLSDHDYLYAELSVDFSRNQ